MVAPQFFVAKVAVRVRFHMGGRGGGGANRGGHAEATCQFTQ